MHEKAQTYHPGMPPPATRDIQAFLAVAGELSFRRAAERLGMDQSALTRRIRALEARLGCTLLRRTTRRVELTEPGRVLLERAAPALRDLGQAAELARRAARGQAGRVIVAYMSFAAALLIPEAIRRFTERYPEAAVEPRYLSTQAQKVALARDEIDAGFLIGPFRRPGLRTVRVAQDEVMAVVGADHPFSCRSAVSLAEIAAQPLILGAPGEWDAFRAILREAFATAGLTLDDRVRYQPSDTNGIFALVAAGLGVTFYAGGHGLAAPRGVEFIPLTGEAPIVETLLAWNPARLSAPAASFVAIARAGAA